VRGIGAKSALRLVQACGGLEGVLGSEDWPGVKVGARALAGSAPPPLPLPLPLLPLCR
jgi:hypothetical protein